MYKINIALILSYCLLVGCASPYKAHGLGGGYTDMALNQDTYFVTFRGNGYTSAEKVQSYTLRRSAELTLEKGYKYFIILNGGTSASSQIIETPTTVQTQSFGDIQGYGNYGYGSYNYSGYGSSSSYTTIHPGRQYNIHRYKSGITIKMLHSNKESPQSYDAAVILSNYQK